ncbi:magnesium/cobalt transporter CorA [Peribacillus acanthi]|uniref:magnesium/cobalt transporter CorA n=1 Tax=Peribacillus acanthi TaxID=2171554 RepID=UPI000D3E48EA|nr:magnesium/cobalt transporter CorA [Peribacillus acanthi]
MIHTMILKQNGEIDWDAQLEDVKKDDVKWFWVDISKPTPKEEQLLTNFFQFHPLAVEDCLDHYSQRSKMDFYEGYQFLIVHAICPKTLTNNEIDIFVNKEFIVSFHRHSDDDMLLIRERIMEKDFFTKGTYYVLHSIIDKLVDDYFPQVYSMESKLNEIEDNPEDESIQELMERLFDIRTAMSKLRRTILPMRDLVYRIIHSERLHYLKEQHLYFQDVYDHLIRLVEMIESYREFSSDVRDSYLSMNSNRMNGIMMTLTVITTIFMPLSFLAGIYGMNFQYMPELSWKYGYFVVLAIMFLTAGLMMAFFMRKGWFRYGRGTKKNKRIITWK